MPRRSKAVQVGNRTIRATYTVYRRQRIRPTRLPRRPHGWRPRNLRRAVPILRRTHLRQRLQRGEEVIAQHRRLVGESAVLVLGEAHEDACVTRRELVRVLAPECFLRRGTLGRGGGPRCRVHGLCDCQRNRRDVAGRDNRF